MTFVLMAIIGLSYVESRVIEVYIREHKDMV